MEDQCGRECFWREVINLKYRIQGLHSDIGSTLEGLKEQSTLVGVSCQLNDVFDLFFDEVDNMSNTLREFQEDEIKEVQVKEEIKEREAQGKSKGVGKGKEDKGKEGNEGNSKEGEAPGSEQSQSSPGGSADFEHDEQPELAEILADDEFQRTRARVASGLRESQAAKASQLIAAVGMLVIQAPMPKVDPVVRPKLNARNIKEVQMQLNAEDKGKEGKEGNSKEGEAQQLDACVCGIDGRRRLAMKTCSYCKGNACGKHTRVRSMFRECAVCESTPLQCENGLNLGPTEAD